MLELQHNPSSWVSLWRQPSGCANRQGYAIISEPEPWHRCSSKACDGEVERLIGSIHQRLTKNCRYKTDRAPLRVPKFSTYNRFLVENALFFPGYPRLHGWQIRDDRARREVSRRCGSPVS